MIIEMQNLDTLKIHELFINAMAPLPVTLISTVGADGVYNAAPFSAVCPISWEPPLICVSIASKSGVRKDTARNIAESGDFVINMMSEDFVKPLLTTSGDYPSNVNEIEKAGLTSSPAVKVKAPLIKEAPVNFECTLYREIEIGEGETIRWVYFGEVLLVHVRDEILTAGSVDPIKARTVGYLGKSSLGKRLFCRTTDILKL
jgi:flavin reductase (DIM6/NTAB) family NADH-FMN oxidoreductase RutF